MVHQSCLLSTYLPTKELAGTKLIMLTSTCRMENIGCYGWNYLQALPCLCFFILLEERKITPLLTSLWWIRQGLSRSTYVLLEFYLLHFSATSQSLWCFMGNQTSNLWSGHLSLSFTLWLCYASVYPITVNKSFVTTLQVLLFYLVFLSDCDFQVLRRDLCDTIRSLQTLPVLCPFFWDLTHFLHISTYFIKNAWFASQELQNDKEKDLKI